ncbi:DUF1833 domain-containing protein [Dechloromonas sp. TW-R-39-2]|uniref:DUF1833 family protein n=1 Tax=Dechloromonas sp. TW-R-39-2 TaxID=2654218 RepID=UPI00193E8384|nr:DUF1833 family protein [Dechloromonas sp. TW-R-39-2]QRM19563.1 DUF1833 domain-containing protein [Dechloromonas sp. TW-R-39-2]
MSDLMTEALKEAWAVCPTNLVVFETIQIDHADFDAPLRLVNDYADLTATLETAETVTFTRFAFESVGAEVNAQGLPEVVITVDGASAEIAEALDAISDSADALSVTMRTFRSDDLSAPAGRNVPGEVRNISVEDVRVTLRIGFGEIANRPFPSELYTPRRFPGLVR